VAKREKITEIGLDGSGNLFVVPANALFEYIYRAASSVRWDQIRGRLYVIQPHTLTEFRCFESIEQAVREEYGIFLFVDAKTIWTNVETSVQDSIEFHSRINQADNQDEDDPCLI